MSKTIKSVSDYIAELNRLNVNSSVNFIFRGQSNSKWALESGAKRRLKNQYNTENRNKLFCYSDLFDYHHNIINEIKNKGYQSNYGRVLADHEILAELQHSGCATILIDFTKNALIALFFAVNEVEEDGQIYLFKLRPPRFREVSFDSIKGVDIFNNNIFEERVIYYWEPNIINNRIPMQHSIFIFDTPMFESYHDYQIIKVKSKYKSQIKNELKAIFNIDEVTLFNDFQGYARENYFKKCLKQYTWEYYLKKGSLGHQKGLYSEAINAFDMAIEINQNNFELYELRGLTYLALKQFEYAIDDFNESIKKGNNDPNIYHSLGIALDLKGAKEEAIQNIDMAISKKRDPEFLYNKGIWLLLDQNEVDKAIEIFNEVIEKDKNFDEAYFNLGYIYQKKKETKEAEELYRKCLSINPYHTNSYINLAKIKIDDGKFSDAKRLLDKAIYINGDNDFAYYNCASICILHTKKLLDGLGYIDNAIKINPNVPIYYSMRARAFIYLNNKRAALENLYRALKLIEKGIGFRDKDFNMETERLFAEKFNTTMDEAYKSIKEND